ncbi:neural Wiskott-Aldrich syndrome protein-like [Centruroides sculpturatus]|uniref:neural Wiskott-Aldrich syndrome protein-like n=1 Tax=Centruroides sculpturatus TaxID=218467 RepID=UPI000C6D4C9A|nr:neural Wiskott-Aldrich syndrome protein-like [Centruroides sculpturatus]
MQMPPPPLHDALQPSSVASPIRPPSSGPLPFPPRHHPPPPPPSGGIPPPPPVLPPVLSYASIPLPLPTVPPSPPPPPSTGFPQIPVPSSNEPGPSEMMQQRQVSLAMPLQPMGMLPPHTQNATTISNERELWTETAAFC